MRLDVFDFVDKTLYICSATFAGRPMALPFRPRWEERSLSRVTAWSIPCSPSALRAVMNTVFAPARRIAVAACSPRPLEPNTNQSATSYLLQHHVWLTTSNEINQKALDLSTRIHYKDISASVWSRLHNDNPGPSIGNIHLRKYLHAVPRPTQNFRVSC